MLGHCVTFAQLLAAMEKKVSFAVLRDDVFARDLASATVGANRVVIGKRVYHSRGRGLRVYADRIGISHATLSRLIAGKPPDLVTYARCCRFMGVPLDYYFS